MARLVGRRAAHANATPKHRGDVNSETWQGLGDIAGGELVLSTTILGTHQAEQVEQGYSSDSPSPTVYIVPDHVLMPSRSSVYCLVPAQSRKHVLSRRPGEKPPYAPRLAAVRLPVTKEAAIVFTSSVGARAIADK